MPIPNSGTLTLSMIQAEFGGSNPISLSEYYAGGGRVPAGTSGINGPVPSSGAISLSSFYGTSAAVPLTVSVSPAAADGTFTNNPASNSPATRSVASNSVTASPSGGTPGYTYSWARVSGSTDITASAPTSESTNFSATVPVSTTLQATFRVTVTDSLGATATRDVVVTLIYDSGF